MKETDDLNNVKEYQFSDNVEDFATSKVNKRKIRFSYKGLIIAIAVSVTITCFITTKVTSKFDNYSLVMLYRLSDQLVNCGFTVDKILIDGNEYVSSDEIRKLVDARSIFFVSLADLRNKIESSHPWIKDVSVKRLLPNTLQITVQEYSAFANWHHDNKNSIIDSFGHVIVDNCSIRDDLTSIHGDGALTHLDFIREVVNDNTLVGGMVSSITYVDSHWWDIVLSSGLNIKLPNNDSYAAWRELLNIYKASSEFLVWKTIDMRVPGKVNIMK
ncbi:cell division protein FtsQ/DivIB [Ehrlichia ruminantium]|uniref:cell division protein FtsQ/DivIB n=1 Tax=Ehrlichia ruminantium TaxID=779 RepID=UPI0007A0C93D|nr:FtsQ-type POTRA domain-containing protein [Ehrlichia ruminantium]KYW90523.1 cell division protein FtsQ [Ehrlichia ruminantium]